MPRKLGRFLSADAEEAWRRRANGARRKADDAGGADRGRPVFSSEFLPAKGGGWTTGTRIGVVGNLSAYQIAPDLGTSVTAILSERYAASNQTGVVMTHSVDGMPGYDDAFIGIEVG